MDSDNKYFLVALALLFSANALSHLCEYGNFISLLLGSCHIRIGITSDIPDERIPNSIDFGSSWICVNQTSNHADTVTCAPAGNNYLGTKAPGILGTSQSSFPIEEELFRMVDTSQFLCCFFTCLNFYLLFYAFWLFKLNRNCQQDDYNDETKKSSDPTDEKCFDNASNECKQRRQPHNVDLETGKVNGLAGDIYFMFSYLVFFTIAFFLLLLFRHKFQTDFYMHIKDHAPEMMTAILGKDTFNTVHLTIKKISADLPLFTFEALLIIATGVLIIIR